MRHAPRSSSAPCLLFRDSRWKRRINFRLSLYFRGKPRLSFRIARRETHTFHPLHPSFDWREPAVIDDVLCAKLFKTDRTDVVNCCIKVAGRHRRHTFLLINSSRDCLRLQLPSSMNGTYGGINNTKLSSIRFNSRRILGNRSVVARLF